VFGGPSSSDYKRIIMRETARHSTSPERPHAVSFVDLGASNRALKDAVLQRIGETIDRGDFTNGQAVVEFEQRFAAHTKHFDWHSSRRVSSMVPASSSRQ
jgi:hypothetical protein